MATHLMIDIETLGQGPAAVIASIGAVAFTHQVHTTVMDRRVNITQPGRDIDTDTVLWWLKQCEEARAELTSEEGRVSLWDALLELNNLITKLQTDGEVYVWANSPAFDLVILRHAFEQASIPCPWDWRNERDVRTVRSLVPDAVCVWPEDRRNAHTAVADCEFQVLHVQICWNFLGVKHG
jgi:exodeoxyribonuclease VIII